MRNQTLNWSCSYVQNYGQHWFQASVIFFFFLLGQNRRGLHISDKSNFFSDEERWSCSRIWNIRINPQRERSEGTQCDQRYVIHLFITWLQFITWTHRFDTWRLCEHLVLHAKETLRNYCSSSPMTIDPQSDNFILLSFKVKKLLCCSSEHLFRHNPIDSLRHSFKTAF